VASADVANLFLSDNHSGIGSRFARLVKLAAANGGQFSVTALNQMYGQNAAISVAQNPKLFANSYTILVILGEVCRPFSSLRALTNA
jgi:hypothetical protein